MGVFVASGAALAETPRPEHPRPDFERTEWLNLNGPWDFFETDAEGVGPETVKFDKKITVPFCRESKLSGLANTGFIKNVWYRRSFQVPGGWKAGRTLLHIGACDWRTTVWVNGARVGEHVGGSVSFAFDVSDHLQAGDNTVVIHAYDDTRSGIQALGKQARTPKSESIFYTRTTGIWQTVWLERVGDTYVKAFRIEPDVDGSRFVVGTDVVGDCTGLRVKVVCSAAGSQVAQAEAPADWRNGKLLLTLSKPRLWKLADPFLYEFSIEIRKGDSVVDKVKSYAGMRKVAIDGQRILINGEPVFQRLVLDQGFYPDGVWTAPTDAALKHDIEMSKAVGFNGARLHQKVFEPRFLYWADKLGYLVWGEFPNYGLNHTDPRAERPVIEEWNAIVARDRNHPAIIGWCPFNETPVEAGPLQNTVVRMTWQLDPSRPVIDTSGYIHSLPQPEVMDAHDYDQNPVSFRSRWDRYFGGTTWLPAQYGTTDRRDLPFMVSEFGGIGWDTGAGWGYGNPPKTLDEFYERLEGLVSGLTDNPNMFGFCYTQLTDVEQERNGIYRYDRQPKFDTAKVKAIFGRKAAYETTKPVSVERSNWQVAGTLVGSVRDGVLAKPWKYTIKEPSSGWQGAGFDASAWSAASGGFGQKEDTGKDVRTPWSTSDIWLRQEFDYDGRAFDSAVLAIHFDNATEVYVNGEEIWRSDRGAWNDRYEAMNITDALRRAIKTGKNFVAVHCHQDTGGQYIDLGMILLRRV